MTISDKPQAEFEKWWPHTPLRHVCSETLAKQIWASAWTAAKLDNRKEIKLEVLSDIKEKFRADSATAFLAGHDEEAFWFRRMVHLIENREAK